MKTFYKTSTRLLLFCIITFCSISSVLAQRLNGLLFESSQKITININGQDINDPSQSCFIANLKRGDYFVKAFINGRCVYEEEIFYNGRGVEKIIINRGSEGGNIPNNEVFTQLLKVLKEASFDDKKLEIIETANFKNIFSIEEVKVLISQFTFSSGRLKAAKLLYRSCYKKPLYFSVVDLFSFQREKDELLKYIRTMKN